MVKSKSCNTDNALEMAGGLGFEPRLAESESAVLPLDDPPKDQCLVEAGRYITPDFRRVKGLRCL